MAPPVALITGASSGIGLALTHHLLSKSWAVAMLDINPPPTTLPNTLFLRTDVSSWNQQAAAFKTAFDWHGRLDVCALNAGIDDRDDIFASVATSGDRGAPRRPNMLTFEVNLFAPYYGLKLAAHYMALNAVPGGKIVITSSSAGLYALPMVPQYSATKHALVGLTRALAPGASRVDIAVNAICPAMVATGLAPAGLMDAFGEGQITPMSTIMRAFDELAEFDRVGERDWVGTGHRGQVVEASVGHLYYRDEVEHADDSQKHMTDGAASAWATAYAERNRKFALMD